MAMELDHSFTVPVPPDQAWDVLLDVRRIAPCMPGATVESVEGDDVTGRMKVKVGPVSLTYKGNARFSDRDPSARTMLVEASGKETRGAGTASATVRAELRPDSGGSDGSTLVTLHTTLNVTGRPAQFGRGVMVEVGGKLIGQFADNLATQLSGGNGGAAAAEPAGDPGQATQQAPAPGPVLGADPGTTSAPSTPSANTWEPAGGDDAIDLLSVAGPAVMKRVLPVAGAVAALGLVFWRVRRLVRRRRAS